MIFKDVGFWNPVTGNYIGGEILTDKELQKLIDILQLTAERDAYTGNTSYVTRDGWAVVMVSSDEWFKQHAPKQYEELSGYKYDKDGFIVPADFEKNFTHDADAFDEYAKDNAGVPYDYNQDL